MMFSILFNTIDAALLVKVPDPLNEQALVEMQEKFDEYELAYFTGQLDDGVEVVSINKLLATVEQNIPYKFAQPN